ncbi:hypothetical protein NKH23_20315, partial [Mesorhizobium sp. M1328]|uniref:hypothetical protein n=1 Tax=Mesorhizobium sp. M1328 TaxID=2957082 RepID=UPI00333A36D0
HPMLASTPASILNHKTDKSGIPFDSVKGGTALKQFQEKCETVFHPELRQNKKIERFGVSVKR